MIEVYNRKPIKISQTHNRGPEGPEAMQEDEDEEGSSPPLRREVNQMQMLSLSPITRLTTRSHTTDIPSTNARY